MPRRLALLTLAVFTGVLMTARPAVAQVNNLGATQVAAGLSVSNGVAYAARHDVYLTVYESGGGVMGRFVNAAGATVGNAFMIAATGQVAYANKPMVAYSHDTADDVFFVMFATDRGKGFDGPPSAYIQRVTFNGTGGTVVGGPFLASDGSYELPNDIVYNPFTRKFVAVWERVFPGNQQADVELRFINVDSTPSGSIVNVSLGNWSQGAARVAVDWETNRIMVAYQGVSPASPPNVEILGLWAKIVDGSTGAVLTNLLTVQPGFTIEPVSVFSPERDGFIVAWTAFVGVRDVQARFVSSATGSVGSMPAPTYTIAGTNRAEGVPMGIYDAISRRILIAIQSGGGCPNDTCAYLDGAVLDAMGAVQAGSPFTGLSTPPPSPTGGTFYPDVAVGEGGQFGISFSVNYNSNYVQRVSLPAAPTPGPIFGDGGTQDEVLVSPASLSFAIFKSGSTIGGFSPQPVSVTFNTAPVAWSVATSTPWLQVASGSGSGNGQFTVTIINPGNVIGSQTSLSGSVVLTAPGKPNSPVTIPVSLTVSSTLPPAMPFGQVDTPAQSATGVQGAVAVTGWSLDDTLVSSVRVYRNCFAFDNPLSCQTVLGYSVVFVGQAVFLTGARPDVAAAFPLYPNADRAGWGVQVLTNSLPHTPSSQLFGGQGPVTLYAVATDNSGNKKLLGRTYVSTDPAFSTPTSITLANDSIAKPFGTLDTPAQGGTVSGTIANFGWALTPDTNIISGDADISIPNNGSTVNVYIDGVLRSPVAFNQCRGNVGNPVPGGVFCNDDISSIFGNATPQPSLTPRSSNPTKFRNLDAARGPIGAYLLNTTTLTNGLHTIAWSVMDSAGRVEGVGSRFFTVANAFSGPSFAQTDATSSGQRLSAELDDVPVGADGVWGRTGFDPRQSWQAMPLDSAGERRVRVAEMGRLDVWFGAPIHEAYLVANGRLLNLPAGSTIEGANFVWAPGPGHVGDYSLVFLRGAERIDIRVTVDSRSPHEGDPAVRMHLDTPLAGGRAGSVTVTGWALDPTSEIGAGIDAVHVWARRLNGHASAATFFGAATVGLSSPEAAQATDSRFSHSGFSLTASLPSGDYELTAYVWNRRTSRWEDARSVIVSVR